jgi:hypothetical protein
MLIRDNEALLLSLGLSAPSLPRAKPKSTIRSPKTPKTPTLLRKTIAQRKLDPTDSPATSQASTPGSETEADGSPSLRRSSRSSGRKVDYRSDGVKEEMASDGGSPRKRGKWVVESDEEDGEREVLRQAKSLGKRIHDP